MKDVDERVHPERRPQLARADSEEAAARPLVSEVPAEDVAVSAAPAARGGAGARKSGMAQQEDGKRAGREPKRLDEGTKALQKTAELRRQRRMNEWAHCRAETDAEMASRLTKAKEPVRLPPQAGKPAYVQQLQAPPPPEARWQQVGRGRKAAIRKQEKSPLEPTKASIHRANGRQPLSGRQMRHSWTGSQSIGLLVM